ncbi:MAG: MFS transporter [Candidatus Latescibacterota bacterium]|nr:MFS transporter [Candidatus Latescibacterota bacterium]
MTPSDHCQGPTPAGLWSRAFVVLCLLSFLGGVANAPYGSLLPVYVESDLQRLPLFSGYLRAVALLLGAVFAVISGRLCDLFGLKITLMLGLAGSTLSGLVFHASAAFTLTLLVIVIGAGGGPTSTAGQSYLIAAAGARRLGLGGALYFLSSTLGQALGNAAVGALEGAWNFPELGTAMTAAQLGILALGIALLPSGERVHPREREQGFSLWASYWPLLARRDVHLLIGLRLCITGFWGMASLLLPLLVFRVSGSAGIAAYYGAVSLAFACACQLLTGALRDRYGRNAPLLVSALGIVVSACGLTLSLNSVIGLFVWGTALTSTAWAVSVLVPGLIDEVAGKTEKSRLVGLGHMVWSTAMVGGSLLGGWLVEIDSRLPFLFGMVSCSVGTLCSWRLCRRLDTTVEAVRI